MPEKVIYSSYVFIIVTLRRREVSLFTPFTERCRLVQGREGKRPNTLWSDFPEDHSREGRVRPITRVDLSRKAVFYGEYEVVPRSSPSACSRWAFSFVKEYFLWQLLIF